MILHPELPEDCFVKKESQSTSLTSDKRVAFSMRNDSKFLFEWNGMAFSYFEVSSIQKAWEEFLSCSDSFLVVRARFHQPVQFQSLKEGYLGVAGSLHSRSVQEAFSGLQWDFLFRMVHCGFSLLITMFAVECYRPLSPFLVELLWCKESPAVAVLLGELKSV